MKNYIKYILGFLTTNLEKLSAFYKTQKLKKVLGGGGEIFVIHS